MWMISEVTLTTGIMINKKQTNKKRFAITGMRNILTYKTVILNCNISQYCWLNAALVFQKQKY